MHTDLKLFYSNAKAKTNLLVFHSVIMFLFSQAGALINFITNLIIVPHYFNPSQIGAISPIIQYVALGALPLTIITNLIIKFITKYEAKQEWGKLKSLIRDIIIFGVVSTFITAIIFVISFKSFAIRVDIESTNLLFWMLIYLCISSWSPLLLVLTRSAQRFFIIAASSLLAPIVLCISSITLLPKYRLEGYIIALILSTIATAVLSIYSILDYILPHTEAMESYFDDCKPLLKKYLLIFIIAGCIGWLYNFIPPFVIKHFLSAKDAAGYFIAFRLGQMPFYAVSSLLIVILPFLSSIYEKGGNFDKTETKTIYYTIISGVLTILLLYFATPYLFDIVPQWKEYSEYAQYVTILAINTLITSINAILINSFIVKWNFKFYLYTTPITLIACLITYSIFGWGAFRNIIPSLIWEYFDNLIPRSLSVIIAIMTSVNLLTLLLSIFLKRQDSSNNTAVDIRPREA